jgi:hypothetical protein
MRMLKAGYKIASSEKAWREGIWPTKEWGLFDASGNFLFNAPTKRKVTKEARRKGLLN